MIYDFYAAFYLKATDSKARFLCPIGLYRVLTLDYFSRNGFSEVPDNGTGYADYVKDIEKRDHAAQGKESRDKQSWETRHQSGLEIFRNDRDDEYCRNQDKDKRKHAEKAYRSVVFIKRKNGFQHFASILESPEF